MPDVHSMFFSYRTREVNEAKPLLDALAAVGVDVWRDTARTDATLHRRPRPDRPTWNRSQPHDSCALEPSDMLRFPACGSQPAVVSYS